LFYGNINYKLNGDGSVKMLDYLKKEYIRAKERCDEDSMVRICRAMVAYDMNLSEVISDSNFIGRYNSLKNQLDTEINWADDHRYAIGFDPIEVFDSHVDSSISPQVQCGFSKNGAIANAKFYRGGVAFDPCGRTTVDWSFIMEHRISC